MLLIWFFDPTKEQIREPFQDVVLADLEVRKRLESFICVQLPVSTTRFSPAVEERDGRVSPHATKGAESLAEGGKVKDEPRAEDLGHVSAPAAERLIDHPAFAELTGESGLAILDFTEESSPNYHHVVSIYPMESRRLSTEQMIALLDLPPGSLTQRTLIWAVWTHPERPESASGEPHDELEREAESHSRHQAVIRVQGHHRWGSRFQRLLGRIPPGHVPQEVCAESWPGQRLIDAAEECVRSWRHSTGHWDAVRRPHPIFGYDMKRGSNGIWYATGLFGRRQ
jgi:hypothetical protein